LWHLRRHRDLDTDVSDSIRTTAGVVPSGDDQTLGVDVVFPQIVSGVGGHARGQTCDEDVERCRPRLVFYTGGRLIDHEVVSARPDVERGTQ